MDKLVSTFRAPGSAYRGKPFWAWNGALEEDELRRQIRVMQQMGFGGFFMHSRVGLATEYLSETWMARIRACIDEARALGMEAWLYDEDRWPSGAGGGLVTRDPACRQRFLHCRRGAAVGRGAAADVLACFAVRWSTSDRLAAVRRLDPGGTVRSGEEVLEFQVEEAPPDPWYNGFTYLDTMDHEAVRKFVATTHEAYRREFGSDFGGVVPGIFTDEPNHGYVDLATDSAGHKPLRLPWTPRLPGIFRERYGYDLLDHLPELFYDLAATPVSRARYHYHDATTFLFVDAFARQVGAWCDRHGLRLTGHVLFESTTTGQTAAVGSAMRFYEPMQVPGIDVLTEHYYEYDTVKQCASVLHQTGRKWMLSELYGCTGWQFPFEGHKAVGDWQAALGVNLRCQHLSWYTMLGEAKRDYPASILHQSPWWDLYRHVEDYFARLNVLLSEGEPVRDLLVLHPVESTWVRFVAGATAAAERQEMDDILTRLQNTLLRLHVDFDYADEEILSRLGRIDGGAGETRLLVGCAAYRVVLVPPTRTLRGTTVTQLREFAARGGRLVFAGAAPDHIDAVPDPAARELSAMAAVLTCALTPSALRRAVQPARRLSIRTGSGRPIGSVLYQLRRAESGSILFVCNTDRRKGYRDVRIVLDGADAEEWDPRTGERFRAETRHRDAGLEIRTELHASGSRLFLIRDERVRHLRRRPRLQERRRLRLGARRRWPVSLSEPNVLVLDRPASKLGAGRWQPPTEILRLDARCRERLGLAPRGGQMVQPWARLDDGDTASEPLQLRYEIVAATCPEGPLALAVEQPGRFRIRLNDARVGTDVESGWWVDRSLRTLRLDPALFRAGRNTLVLETQFGADHDLEIIYLLGRFGVRIEPTGPHLIPVPASLRVGDWTEQGLPFYSGSVTYRTEIDLQPAPGERVFLVLPEFAGACARVFVDAVAVGISAWPPNEVDITEHLGPGPVAIGIEIVGHRRNSHGPLHHVPPTPIPWIGPSEFVTAGPQWRDDYALVPMGLRRCPLLSIRSRA